MIGPTAAPQPTITRETMSPPPSTNALSSGNRAIMDAIALAESPRTVIRLSSIQTASLAVDGAMSSKSAIVCLLWPGRCRRVAHGEDAEVAGRVVLLDLGLDLERRKVVLVGDEREVARRVDRDSPG